MIELKGKRFRGGGGASKNLVTQIPLIKREFPEIEWIYPGTLNLKLTQPLLIVHPDHRTSRIDWHPDHSPGEVFDFLRISFEAPKGAQAIPAWLYIAHNSDWRKDETQHEVVCPFIGNLAAEAECRVIIERDYVQMPYKQRAIIVV